MLSSGLSSFHPLTRNPWNLTRNPGGSSSGAAAAGAAGYGPLHVGTDIGGSIRLPAGWTGLVGLKPSHGRVPIDPFYLGRVAGPMTRTVMDCALLMRCLARPDRRDATSLPAADLPWTDLETDVRGLKIGLMMDAGCGLPVEDEVRQAVLGAARMFEAAGAHVEPVGAGADPGHAGRARQVLAGPLLGRPRRPRRGGPGQGASYIRAWAGRGAEVGGVEAIQGYEQTVAMRRNLRGGLRRGRCGDLADRARRVLPGRMGLAPQRSRPAVRAHRLHRTLEHGEQPAASINCGLSREGLPIGLQIVGPRFDDMRVLRLARAFETWRGPMTAWPRPPGCQSMQGGDKHTHTRS